MMTTTEEKTVKVEVKCEADSDNAFLSENENDRVDSMVDQQVNANFKCKEEIDNEGPSETYNKFITENENDRVDSMVDQQVNANFKCKEEIDNEGPSETSNKFTTENDRVDSMVDQQVNANFKCKEEIDDELPYETSNKFKTENPQNIEEFYEKREVDEIDISKTILQSTYYDVKLEKENDSENQKAFTQTNSPDDDHKEKKCRSTMRSNSIRAKKAKTKNCQFCNAFFTTKRFLDDHMLKHHKQEIKGDLKSLITSKIYTCHICNSYETTEKMDIDRHGNSVHNEVNFKMKCQFCLKSFIRKQSLDGHVLNKHKDKIMNDVKSFITTKIHICEICNSYETTRKSHLDQHVNLVHNEAKFKIECQFCTKSFICKQSLDRHVLNKHEDEMKNNVKSFITKIHICKICNSYETTYKSHLDQHINSVHNEVKFKMKCQFCTKSFTRKQSLDGHVINKHKDKIKNNVESFITSKIHVCKICNSYETTRKSDLDQHVNSVHNEAKLKMECQFCTKSFLCKKSLDGHILSNHKDEIKNNIKSFITTKIHVCKICNSYETTVKSHLDQHINSVHNKVNFKMECQFCTKSFIRKQSLDGHVLNKHKDEFKNNVKSFITTKIHRCKICNSYETTRKSHLHQHINWVHNKVKFKMKCKFCTKSFICKQSLDGHVLNKHKDKIKNNVKSFITNKIHICKICNSYETTHKASFYKHINSAHNEVKTKMMCQFCPDSFMSKISLDEHILRKHKDKIKDDIKNVITNKIHSCKICSFEFMTKHNLNRHVNLVHNKKMKWKCEFCHQLFKFKNTLKNHVLKQHKGENLHEQDT